MNEIFLVEARTDYETEWFPVGHFTFSLESALNQKARFLRAYGEENLRVRKWIRKDAGE